jgi:hypothetical protein
MAAAGVRREISAPAGGASHRTVCVADANGAERTDAHGAIT